MPVTRHPLHRAVRALLTHTAPILSVYRQIVCLAEACAVAWANDLVAFDGAAGKPTTIMGADVFDGIILTIEVKYDDLRVVYINNPSLAWRDFFDPRYRDPFTHCKPSFIQLPPSNCVSGTALSHTKFAPA